MIKQDTYFKELGERIEQHRKEAGLSQTQLAAMIGLSQQMIAEYESGNRKHLPLCRLIDLAEVFGVDLSELLNLRNGSAGKRGPASKIQQLVERIGRLPKTRQKFVVEMLEHALKVDS